MPHNNGDGKVYYAEQQRKRFKAKPRPPHVEIITAADLLTMSLPEPTWAVDGILPEGLTILAGKPKLGKSWLALNIGLAVATGGAALGMIPVEAGDVLYLALEDTRRRLKNRLQKMLAAANAKAPGRLHLTTGWPRFDDGGEQHLGQWLGEHPQARLVVIDIFAKVRPSRRRGEDLYAEDYYHGCVAKELADKHHVALLILFHCRKVPSQDPIDTVSGTLGMVGAADGVLVLTRERGKHDAALFVTGRDIEEKNVALQWDPAYGLWSIMGDAEEYRLSQERRAVLALFKGENLEWHTRDIADRLDKNEVATRKLVSLMSQDGQLKALGKGKYTLSSLHSGNNVHKDATLFVNGVTVVNAGEREPGEDDE